MMAIKEVVGAKITGVRWMTPKEYDDNCWDEDNYKKAIVIELSNGLKIYPSQDDEGNGPGTMFGNDGKQQFYIFPPEVK